MIATRTNNGLEYDRCHDARPDPFKKKPTPGGRAKRKTEVSFVRSSAAEYLTFIAASGQGGSQTRVQAVFYFL